jgi:Flp pilus assembly protein TadD
MLVGALVCGAMWSPAASATAAEPAKMLILPFSGPSRGDGLWLGEGVALSLAGQLSGGDLQVFQRGDVEELLEENGLPVGAPLSRGSMIYVAGRAGADFAILGNFTVAGATDGGGKVKLAARALEMKTLKSGNELAVSGPLANLPELENELAWLLYTGTGAARPLSREQFRERTRKAPNAAYASYVQSLLAPSEANQLKLLEKAIKDYPDFPEAHFQMGRLHYRNRDYEKALPHLQYGMKIPGMRHRSGFLIGTCHLQSGRTDEAVKTYKQILSWARRPAVLNNLAVAYVRNGDDTSALHTLLEARGAAPADSTVAMNLAITRYLLGNSEAAVESLEDAIKAHPGNGMLYFVASFLMEAVGDEIQASEDAAKAIHLGIPVEKLQQEPPKTWMRVISTWAGGEEEP